VTAFCYLERFKEKKDKKPQERDFTGSKKITDKKERLRE